MPISFAGSAGAAIGSYAGFFTVVDQAGPNDVPAQNDLTQMGRDDSNPNLFRLAWSWDSTDQWTGVGQTGDACALFDTDGDGNINYAVCAQIHNVGGVATVVQTAISPTAWVCGDAKNDRCTTPTPIVLKPGDVAAGVLGNPADSGGNLITATDPFYPGNPTGSNYPNDASIEVDIATALGGGFLPASAAMTNVCSYPSIGNGGNNNPFDCIVNPGAGFLVINKTAVPNNPVTFPFTVNPGNIAAHTVGTGSTDPIVVAIGTNAYSFAETVPGGWSLTSASCVLADGVTATGIAAANGVSGITVQSGKTTTCDVTDTKLLATATLTKSANPTVYKAAGDQITYTLDMTNTGNIDLNNAVINDPLFGGDITSPCTQTHNGVSAAVTPPVTLAPGDVLECKPVYTITAADVTAKSVPNTATGNATPSNPNVPYTPPTASTTIHLAAFTLTKSAAPLIYSNVGDQITYTLDMTNTGSTDLTNSVISDPLINSVAPNNITSPCTQTHNGVSAAVTPPVTLAPGDVLECTPVYSITAGDIAAGSVGNTATGHGTPPVGSAITHTATATVTFVAPPAPAFTMTKSASPTKYTNVGDQITYTLTMTNTGNTDLTNSIISDPLINPTAPNNITSPCTQEHAGVTAAATPPLTLKPGDVLQCQPVYSITQADINAGSVGNTATGTGTPPGGAPFSHTASANVNLFAPSFTLSKSASPTKYTNVGDQITYTLTMTNTGNTDLGNSIISDPKINSVAPNNITSPCTQTHNGVSAAVTPPVTLKPGDVLECKPVYSITQADITAGSVNNTATGTGTPPGVPPITHTANATVTLFAPAFTITKSASPTTYTNIGDQITYTLTMTNTGNTDLTNSIISDPLFGGNVTTPCTQTHNGISAAVTPPVTLKPGDSLQCKPVYSITAADIGAGSVKNTATGSGTPPGVPPITHSASATVTFVPPPPPPGSPNLTLSKSSVPASGSTVKPGDTITYTLSYANTGNAVANTVVSSDPLPAGVNFTSANNGGTYDAATNTVTWQLNNLAAGATGTVSFVVTVASNVTQGQVITNVGTIAASGVSPVQSNPDTVTVDIPAPPPTPTLTIVKQVDSTVAEYGDTLTYTFTVTAGGADQTGVVVTDALPAGTDYVPASATCSTGCNGTEAAGVVSWNIGDMAAGDTATLTFQVTITRPTPDANGGIPPETITNVGTVSSATVDPVDSNQVKTQVVAVLGEKNVVPPKTKPEPSPLPFTGLPFPLLQTVVLSSLMIVTGLWLTRPRRRRPMAR